MRESHFYDELVSFMEVDPHAYTDRGPGAKLSWVRC